MPRHRKPARLFLRKDEKVWIIIHNGSQIRTGCRIDQRAEAEEALRKYMNDQNRSKSAPLDASKVNLGQIIAIYLDERGPEHKSPERTIHAVSALVPFWAEMKPSEISITKTREYAKYRNVAAATVRRELGVLQAAMNYAQKIMQLDAWIKIELPKSSEPRDRWLEPKEIDLLRKNSPEHLDRFIVLAIMTGRRKRAILDLRWKKSSTNGWVDLDDGIIYFKGAAERESKKRKGSIKIHNKLLDMIRTWNDGKSESVIHYRGRAIKDIDTSFARACKLAKLDDVVPHTLKHTAITRAFQEGIAIERAVDYFATSAATLERVYRQHSPQYQSQAVEIMGRVGKGIIADNIAQPSQSSDNEA
jgi:integrase